MATVDSKGRVVLPKEVRESLGITAGTEVEVREKEGKVVVEPEDDPEEIIDRMETLIDEIPETRNPTPYDELDPQSKDHVDMSRRQATHPDTETTDE